MFEQKPNVFSINTILHAGAIHQVEVGSAGTEQHICVLHNVVDVCLSKSRGINKCKIPACWCLFEDRDVGIEDENMTSVLLLNARIPLSKKSMIIAVMTFL